MALWGNKDAKTASGTIGIANTGVVTGSSTAFTTEAKVGNTIKAGGVDYQIVSITSDTVAKVIMGTNNGNGTVTTASGASYTLSEKPAFVAHESADTFGSGNSSKVFGVDVTEQGAGGDNVTDVAVSSGGAHYKEVPSVTFSGDGTSAAATAVISGGVVASVTVTNGGSSYETVPTVVIAKPRFTVPTASVGTGSNIYLYTAHGLTDGTAVVYRSNGGTAIAGLTNGTTYYVVNAAADQFEVEATVGGGTVDISGEGNDVQYFEVSAAASQATATAVKGTGSTDGANSGQQHVTHSGWVRKTVGTGGRAGRVFYETLVASGTTAAVSGDQADDIALPDA